MWNGVSRDLGQGWVVIRAEVLSIAMTSSE